MWRALNMKCLQNHLCTLIFPCKFGEFSHLDQVFLKSSHPHTLSDGYFRSTRQNPCVSQQQLGKDKSTLDKKRLWSGEWKQKSHDSWLATCSYLRIFKVNYYICFVHFFPQQWRLVKALFEGISLRILVTFHHDHQTFEHYDVTCLNHNARWNEGKRVNELHASTLLNISHDIGHIDMET